VLSIHYTKCLLFISTCEEFTCSDNVNNIIRHVTGLMNEQVKKTVGASYIAFLGQAFCLVNEKGCYSSVMISRQKFIDWSPLTMNFLSVLSQINSDFSDSA
jgi:hypothetical protein